MLIQFALLWLRLETWDEAKVILMFHVAGTGMEIFKTAVGSWIYPEASVLRIGGVPLFTGFMYASVGSYIARARREFDLRFSHHPPLAVTAVLSCGIYANFFLHHYWWDLRYALMLGVAVVFRRCRVYFCVDRVHRHMPFLLGFTLIALFIWLAENIGTFTHTWLYPSQLRGWELVSISKLGAWFMLTIMSYVMVRWSVRPRRRATPDFAGRRRRTRVRAAWLPVSVSVSDPRASAAHRPHPATRRRCHKRGCGSPLAGTWCSKVTRTRCDNCR